MATMTHSTAVRPAGFAGVVGFVKRYIANTKAHIVRVQSATALNKLSDRQLEDIGIERADIDAVALEMSRRAAR